MAEPGGDRADPARPLIRAPAPWVRVRGRRVRAFHALGVAGVAVALALAVGLALAEGLSVVRVLVLSAVAVSTFLGLALVTKAVAGVERLVYYQHEIAVLAAVELALLAAGPPRLPYLEVIALGVGAFLALGRLGCLSAGCCHGRPRRRGLRYGQEHVKAGFPAHLRGVPLAPVQLWEAAGVAVIVAAGVVLALTGPPGAGLAWYLTAYAVLRFGLEEARGDALRPYRGGLSAAQWVSLGQAAAVAALAVAGVLPGDALLAVAAGGLAVAAVALAASRQRLRRRLLAAAHVDEVARVLRAVQRAAPAADVRSGRTTAGLLISAGPGAPGLTHVGLSLDGRPLPAREGIAIGRMVALLTSPDAPVSVGRGPGVVTHVVMGDVAAPVDDRPHLRREAIPAGGRRAPPGGT